MNYVSAKVLGSKLTCRSRISESVGSYAKRQICFSSFSRDCSFCLGVPSFEKERSMKANVVFKMSYKTMAPRLKYINNCGENYDYRLFSIRPMDLFISVRRMAGHSKWQNIRHVKAAKDREKSIIIQKYTLAIRRAVLEGGANPKGNYKLAQLMEEAKKHNVPNATIERNIAKAKATPFRPTIMEIQGPGGCLLVVEAQTDQADRFIHDVKLICRRLGATVLQKGKARSVYDQRGIITVNATKDNSPLDCAKATDVAIEAGAEDVQEAENENKGKSLQFLCDPNDLYAVKKHIESTNYVVDDASIRYVARDDAKVDLNDEQMDNMENLYNQLEELPGVMNIYDNIN